MYTLEQRNARALAQWEDKMNQPPEYPEDSPDWEDKHMEMWDERIMDINGYMLEAITERPDDELKKLARLIRDNQNGTHTTTIGAIVSRWVIDYCKPSDHEVDEAFEQDEGY